MAISEGRTLGGGNDYQGLQCLRKGSGGDEAWPF